MTMPSPWSVVALARDELRAALDRPDPVAMGEVLDAVASVRLALDALPGTAGVEVLSSFLAVLGEALTRHRARPTPGASPDLTRATAQLHLSDHDDLGRRDPPELSIIVGALVMAGEVIQDPVVKAFVLDAADRLHKVNRDLACIRADLADLHDRLGDFADEAPDPA